MAQKRPQPAPKPQGGSNRVFYLIGGAIILAGVGWLVASGGSGVGSAALPTPAEFEAMVAVAEPDKNVGIVSGNPDSSIEIMEFADYSCPACAQFSSFAGKLLRQNYVDNGTVRWVTFDFVLGGFPNTIAASAAARCAGEQGAYWPFHDMLFSRQGQWQTAGNPGGVYAEIAEDMGLDSGAFRSCVSEGRFVDQIAAARKFGETMGVGSTPTLFFQGQRLDLSGVEPYSFIESLIQAQLAAAEGESDTAAEGSEGSQ